MTAWEGGGGQKWGWAWGVKVEWRWGCVWWVSFPKTTEEINGPLTLSAADITSAAQSCLVCFHHQGPNVKKDVYVYIYI